MKQISVFRIPILWLYFGPPIFRALLERGALASLEGNIDSWNMLRIAWWGFWGAVGLYDLLQNRARVGSVLHSSHVLTTTAALWLISIGISAIYSPSRRFTLGFGLLMLVLMGCALDLAAKLAAGSVSLERLFSLLLGFAVAQLLIVAGCLVWDPDLVLLCHTQTLGARILGGFVADVALVSLVVMFMGAQFYLASRSRSRLLYLLIAAGASILFVYSQSRWAYFALFAGGAVSLRRWLVAGSSYTRKVVIGAGTILGACAVLTVALAAYATDRPVGDVVGTIEDAIIRNNETVHNASGRTVIFSVLWSEAAKFPFGMGYAAGPRLFLQRSGDALIADGVDGVFASNIGEAHNMYLEVLAGTGCGGMAAWLGFLGCLISRCGRIPFRKRLLPQVLLICVLVHGFVASGAALPFTQASALLWIVAATLWPGSRGSDAGNQTPVLIVERG